MDATHRRQLVRIPSKGEGSFADVLCSRDARTGARVQLPAEYSERAAYVAAGSIDAGGRPFRAGKMLVFTPGQPVLLTGVEHSTVMLLGGEPLGERFIEWNFVSSSRERIQQAKADWRAGRMKLPDHDDNEFVPLPDNLPATSIAS